MRETWYVVPEIGDRCDHPEQDDPVLLLLTPPAGSLWPAARSLPRRVRGRFKR